MKTHFPRLHRFLAARFSPGEELGLHLTAGVLLLVIAAWIFGAIAEDVVHHEAFTLLDVRVATWLHVHAHAREGLTRAMLFVSSTHDTIGTLVMTALFALWLLARRARYWLLSLAVCVPGGMLLNVLLKYVFQRTRPQFDDPLVSLLTYSFPSGHTVAATLLYGVLAAYLCTVLPRWRTRALVAVAACLMVALVAFSRIYLGAHYLSDVLGAIAEGCAWLAIVITASATWRRRRAGSTSSKK
jgi:membrane-associated phospholipid phosphatase